MHLHHYLVCYDIADPRRLGRVGRLSRKEGIPFQYSVVYLQCDEAALDSFLERLEHLIDPAEDDVRAYRITSPRTIRFLGEPILPEGLHGEWKEHY
ncbi:MAG: CRISPR-associated endonuclease Cas2 [Oceanospirillaceae bacterium]|nr:CRISPR-associated endonuclease Cas2 [Oceanospirillaceae bacterium]